MDILFDCKHCGNPLIVDEQGKGLTVNCPDCGEPLAVPYRSTSSTPPPLDTGDRRSGMPKLHLKRAPEPPPNFCPFCAEMNAATAIKCQHCGSMLNASHTALRQPLPESIPYQYIHEDRPAKSGMNYWIVGIALIIGLVAGYREYQKRIAPTPHIEVNNGRVYYIAPVKRTEALALGNYLTPECFDGAEKMVELSYANGAYCLLFPMKDSYVGRPELKESAAEMALSISTGVFQNSSVVINLCNESFEVFESVDNLYLPQLTIETTALSAQSHNASSVAYRRGYDHGEKMGAIDGSYGTFDHASTDTSVNKSFYSGPMEAGYRMGTSEYSEFSSGYKKGYFAGRH